MPRKYKKLNSSKYKGVCYVKTSDDKPWMMRFTHNGVSCISRYTTEREAAKNYDLKMIDLGEKPVNILKQCT